MAEAERAVRWSIKVSRETDLTLRTYLGARGMKKGDLSSFIEEAVRWRILSLTAQDVRASDAERDTDSDADERRAITDGAGREVRAQRGTKKKG